MSPKTITFRLDVENEPAKKTLEAILLSLEGFQLQHSGPCDLLIFEIQDEIETGFQYLHPIQRSGNIGEIFLTSNSVDSEFLIKVMREGIKEFIPQPIRKEEVISAVSRFKMRHARKMDSAVKPEVKGRLIHVLGTKGGVGSTTVAVNLATGLIDIEGVGGCLLVDMVPLFGDMHVFMGMNSPVFSWMELIKNFSRVDAVYMMSILHKHPSGVHVLPSPIGPPEEAFSNESVSALFGLVRSLFEFTVIDYGQSIGILRQAISPNTDTILIVCNLSLSCLINAKRVQNIFLKYGIPAECIEFVMNRDQKNARLRLEDAEETLGKKMWSIPNDYRLTASAINQGNPLTVLASGSGIARSIRSLGLHLTGRIEKRKEKTGLFR